MLAATDSLYIAASFDHDLLPARVGSFGLRLAARVRAGLGVASITATPEDPVVAVDRLSDPPGMVRRLVGCCRSRAGRRGLPRRPGDPWRRPLLPVAAGSLAALVAARQFVVVADHTAIARNLGDAVERRTVRAPAPRAWWQRPGAEPLRRRHRRRARRAWSSTAARRPAPGSAPWPSQVEHISDVWTRVHPDDRAAVRRSMSPVLDGRRRQSFVECRLSRANGGLGLIRGHRRSASSTRRALSGAVVTLHDVSERRQLTDRLMHRGGPRRAHRPAQPAHADAAASGRCSTSRPGESVRAAAHRPRRLQGHQRQARSRRRGPGARGDRAEARERGSARPTPSPASAATSSPW